MDYVIMSDAACDLASGLAGQDNLDFIPMEYTKGPETLTFVPESSNMDLKGFYDGQRKGDLTKTTQISPEKYESSMRSWLEKGYSILYLALSSGLSSTYQTACMICQRLQKAYPQLEIVSLDTRSATGGMGILMERAIRNREAGMKIRENTADLTEAVRHIHHWFLVQDLMYLQRGGRVSATVATVGTVFHIRPVLRIAPDGKLQTIDKARGNRKAVSLLLDRYEQNRTDAYADPVYVIDADAPEIGDQIQKKLLSRYPDLTIRRCTLSPIIGAHTGPGMAAIIHIGQ